MRARHPRPRRRRPLRGRLQLAGVTFLLTGPALLTAAPASAQWEAPVQPHRTHLAWGEVLLDATLHFRFADAYLGGPSFGDLVSSDDAAGLFDPEGRLRTALSTLGATDPLLRVGAIDGSVQASQTRLPLTLRTGLPWGLELEATARFVRTRLEGDTRLLPTADATLGRSPAIDDASAVQTFVDEVLAATDGFTADGRDWTMWGAAWRAAYRASVLFPTGDSEAATRLRSELDSLNADLVAAGLDPISGVPLFAAGPLDREGFASLTSGAPYGITPFEAAPYVWRNGDIDVVVHYGLLGDARRSADPGTEAAPGAVTDAAGASTTAPPSASTSASPAGRGLRLSAGVRLPVASQSDPDLPFSTAAGNGVFATLAGADGWITSGSWTFAGSLRSVLHGSKDVVRRIGPVDEVFIGRDSRTGLSWTPGSRILGQARAEFQPAGPLRLTLGYTFDLRGEDDYERLGPVPARDGTTAFPSNLMYSDPALLEEGTGGTVHWARGGIRWVPLSEGSFGVDFDVGVPISGEVARAYEWTELRLRVYRTLRLSALFDRGAGG